jgi:RNA polymerase sigma factor (sigma-70 family)
MNDYKKHELGTGEPLPREEEARLFTAYRERGDLAARDRLIAQFLLFARKEAFRAAPSWMDERDVASAAHDGLLAALKTYDPKKSTACFMTYGGKRIRGAVLNALRKERRQMEMKQQAAARAEVETDPDARHLVEVSRVEIAEEVGTVLKEHLTERERDVVRRWMSGETYAVIGAAYGFSMQRAEQIFSGAKAKIAPYLKGLL